MGDLPSSSGSTTAPERPVGSKRSEAPLAAADPNAPRKVPGKVVARRARVPGWLGLVFAFGFAMLVTATATADRWLASLGSGHVVEGQPAAWTVRVPAFAGHAFKDRHLGNGGIVIARGELATQEDELNVRAIAAATSRGALPYGALLLLMFVLAAVFTHRMRHSLRGRLVRVQLVSLVSISLFAVAAKVLLLTTSISVLAIPVAVFALVPAMALDRTVGRATGILAALAIALVGPFDVGIAIVLLVQASVAGLVASEQPKRRWRAALTSGAVTAGFTASACVLTMYLTTGSLPTFVDPLQSAWFVAALGPAIAALVAAPLVPIYQILVGEITRSKLVELEDLSNPLLRQIAERAPGTWQHSLMMANMAAIAADAVGASGRLARVGAYYHDLGKSLHPKYFIENLEPGETSPHDQLPPEASCDAIFAHVTEGIVTARKAGLHERIVDFMSMHHGNGVLEYFWGRSRDEGNPKGFTAENFRYPGHPPQSRETAILAICDAVEAAARALKNPDAASIDSLVQRIVYGKLHLGQLDESGLSMSDLRRISDSLRDTLRQGNHGRTEYPRHKAAQDASAFASAEPLTSTGPRLDSLDRPTHRDVPVRAVMAPAIASKTPAAGSSQDRSQAIGLAETADIRTRGAEDPSLLATAPALARELGDSPGTAGSPPPAAAPVDDPTHLAELADRAAAPHALGDGIHSARKRAATLPPIVLRRPPTIPAPTAAPRRPPTMPPPDPPNTGPAAPPASAVIDPVDLDSAVTNPPPMRHSPSAPPVLRSSPWRPPALVVEDEDSRPTGRRHVVSTPDEDVTHVTDRAILIATASADPARSAGDPASPSPAIDESSAARTEPRMQRFDMPLKAPPVSYSGIQPPEPHEPPGPAWASGLADRIDAALDTGDEWSRETPVTPPTGAELRALTGNPDATRLQSLDEIERLHRASSADADTSEPELLQRRRPKPPTAEVDPDDIEAAIEIAPPARRTPTAIPATRLPLSKKPE